MIATISGVRKIISSNLEEYCRVRILTSRLKEVDALHELELFGFVMDLNDNLY